MGHLYIVTPHTGSCATHSIGIVTLPNSGHIAQQCWKMSNQEEKCSKQELQELCTKSLKQYLRESVIMSSQESLKMEENEKETQFENGKGTPSEIPTEKTMLLRKQEESEEGSPSYNPRYFTEWQSPISDWLKPIQEWQRPMVEYQEPIREWYVEAMERRENGKEGSDEEIFQP